MRKQKSYFRKNIILISGLLLIIPVLAILDYYISDTNTSSTPPSKSSIELKTEKRERGINGSRRDPIKVDELRSTFKSTYLKSLNTETWRLKYDVKFDYKTMIVYMVYQNQNDKNTSTAEFMFNDGKEKLGYQNRQKMKDMLKISHVKYVISYKGKSPHSTYKGAY